ncbi:putative tRNA pseudouridine synthase B [uncultured archaeon]|nr:putative tRNA pseudouridine synthase B [uncultured archaeon]
MSSSIQFSPQPIPKPAIAPRVSAALTRPLDELLDSSFIIVDKPRGPSSHEVTPWVKKLAGSNKSGHSGTLDPNVSGVLPVALGRATKLLSYLTSKDKKYVCLMRTGKAMTEREIKGIFVRFVGEIIQTPPKMSAVAKKPRRRKVYYIKPLQIRSSDVLFEVHCEAGTYIRVLVSDFARFTGGAEMLELRRTSVGSIEENGSHTLQAISDAMWLAREKHDESRIRSMLIPADEALALPKIVLRDAAIEAVCAGAHLFAPGVEKHDVGFTRGSLVALVSLKGELVGVARAEMSSGEMKERKKGAVAVPERIFMKRGTYQKNW